MTISDAVMDGIRTHHMVPGPVDAGGLAGRIEALVGRSPTIEALESLHEAATVEGAGELPHKLRERQLPKERLRAIGRWLARHGTRRAPTAIGIVLLGLAGDTRDREVLLLLGALEDLSRYAVEALYRSQPDPHEAVFELAQRVDGWGRINAVERLAGTEQPHIKAWLLRGGFRNDVLDEYLAYTAATTGGLAEALGADAIDEELLDGAGGILLALGPDGPSRDLAGYADGPVAVERYLWHAGQWPPASSRIGIVGTLRRRLDGLPWAREERERLIARCDALTTSAGWRDEVVRALGSDDRNTFRTAAWAAETIGVDAVAQVQRWVRRRPYDSHLWFFLIDDPDAVDVMLSLAAEVLPLDDLVTGPGVEAGSFTGNPEAVLDLIVSRLDGRPGKGWPLIAVSLANATTRNRYMAVRALAAWPIEAVPGEAHDRLRAAEAIEPVERIRGLMRDLLKKWAD